MSASGGGVARTGSQPSWTPTTTTRMVAVMNSGIDDEVTPSSTIARSTFRSRRRAAYSPAAMAVGIVMTRARPASFAERPAAARIWGSTGCPDTNDSPKSRVAMPAMDSAYRTYSGRFVPSRSLRASTLSCGANGPRIVRPTSRGRTLEIVNTIVTSSHSVTSASSSLRAR